MPKRKTIAFVIHSLNPGGAERVLTSLANELVNNYNVKIITLVKCDSFYELHSSIKLLSCSSLHSEKQSIFNSISEHYKTIKSISRFVKTETVDLLIGFTTSVNVLTIISAILNKKPSIISERNNAILNPPNTLWRILRNFSYKYANYLVVQTAANKKFYDQIISSKKIIIIKNPIASFLASNRIIKEENKEKKTILNVGRLDANKAQDLLIKAFANISNTDDWQVQLVGDGNKKEEYNTLTKDLNIENSVSFLGNVKNVYDYYNNASIFVFTSKSEGFPNALAEALYFGIPCISTNCPNGPSDLIDHDYNGLLVEVDNQKMLEVQLQKLMTDEDLRHTFSLNAMKKSEQLDISLITSLWVNCFNKIW